METSGQFMSPIRQAEILPFETAERPIVGYSRDYPSGLSTGFHAHPRAQLVYAISGVMRVETRTSNYIVPPTTALLLPADVEHAVRMDGPVAMRELFLREETTDRLGTQSRVIVGPPPLRELVVAVCAEPIDWMPGDRGHHLAELIISEIERSTNMPLEL